MIKNTDRVYSHTMALCSKCKEKVTARIIEREARVFLEKFCAKHGLETVLVSSNPDWYQDSLKYVKPRQNTLDVSVKGYKGCPDSCGLCKEHQQHTCLPVIEITSVCDLDCPVCLKKFNKSFKLKLNEFSGIIDRLLECEGQISVINLSGGEPTIHGDIEAMFDIANRKGVLQTSVSTNGLNLLKDKGLRDIFKKHDAIVALQFDGFDSTAYKNLRGKDILRQKLDLIKILEKEDIKYSVVSTIAKSINDNEIVKIVDFFFKSKALSLMFQPIAFTGNASRFDQIKHRITIPDIVSEIEKSSYVKKGDFNPLPCSHYSCFALSYYLKADENEFMSLKTFLGRKDYLEIIANRTLPGLDKDGYVVMKSKIYEFWSAADISMSNQKVLNKVKRILKELNEYDVTPQKAFSIGIESMKAIYIHDFMDVYNFDFGRVIKCCNHYPKPNGKMIPMCAQNVLLD